jgi:hypothetical protein
MRGLLMARNPDALWFLTLIAEGYYLRVHDDRYITCGNPYFEPDNGQDPNIVFDVLDGEDDADGPGSVGSGQLSEVW